MLFTLALVAVVMVVAMPTYHHSKKMAEANIISEALLRVARTAAVATEQGYRIAPGALTVERAKKWPSDPDDPHFADVVFDLWNMGAPVTIATKPQSDGGPPLYMLVAQKPLPPHDLSLPDVPRADAITAPGAYREVVVYYDGTLRQMPVAAPPLSSRQTASFKGNVLGWLLLLGTGMVLTFAFITIARKVRERARLGMLASGALRLAGLAAWFFVVTQPMPKDGAPLLDFFQDGLWLAVALGGMIVAGNDWSARQASA